MSALLRCAGSQDGLIPEADAATQWEIEVVTVTRAVTRRMHTLPPLRRDNGDSGYEEANGEQAFHARRRSDIPMILLHACLRLTIHAAKKRVK